MKTSEMIRELRRLEEVHKNDIVSTGANNWSIMCHDVANRLEELELKIFELEALKIGGEVIEVTGKGSVVNIFDLANDESLLPKNTYAIWLNNKVTGYVKLSEEQAKEINNMKDIGFYLGYDEKTNPDKYSKC